jgi:lysosomal acid lipase/cholesteryl ester hydrolase
MIAGFPSPTAVGVVGQWFQWIVNGKFNYFDYGRTKNFLMYGTEEPPQYNLSNVQSPILTFVAENDYLTSKNVSGLF